MEQKTETGSRTPKVFISYAWTSHDYQEKVVALATRLMESGIEVIIDVWDLKPGHSMYAFMESMVTDSTIDKVLVLCNKTYADKAENYEGGVGTETQIIGPKMYNKVKQETFIPIILEREEQEKDYIPVHMDGRIYIDLDRNFEQGFEELLRLLYKQPILRKPKLGSAPTYIFEEKKTRFKVSGVLSSIREAIIRQPGRIKGLCHDYKKALILDLEEYRIPDGDLVEPYDEQIYNLIHEMVPLRNNYIEFLEQLCGDDSLFNTKVITSLFEDLHAFSGPLETTGPYVFEPYRYFIHEIFLYTVTVLVSRQMYDKLNEICKHVYFVKRRHSHELIEGSYGLFYYYLESLIRGRNSRLSLNRISIHADLIKELSSSSGYSWGNLVEADYILYYIQNIKELEGKQNLYGMHWYPVTSAYTQFSHPSIPLLKKLTSKNHFNEIKNLLSIESVEHLERIKDLSLNNRTPSQIPTLADMLPAEIAIY
ncbi:toll/interleukin-1 receptor domain-containing protein [Bacillus cereus]|uniref:toll/interleukin-1 receptor domain-containing protein n=1 Tax=Bacillus cereus TaxID=1396 RepID=UPI0014954E26|nr:toll/interleukin-1 receptor domain-containing protein [Bacillus cereus]QKE10640.1 toll/interleukin-1 receptor domain-containing protein [Bacillus cereus]